MFKDENDFQAKRYINTLHLTLTSYHTSRIVIHFGSHTYSNKQEYSPAKARNNA